MRKIDEINKDKTNPIPCIVAGLLLTCIIAILLYNEKPFDIMEYFNNKEKVLEVLLFIPTMLFIFIIHELIHMLLFIYFGKGEAKIKVSKEKKYGAIVMHQVNEDVYYTRREILIILLAPLVLLSIVLFFLMNIINMPFLLYFNLILNVLGSSIDFYISIYLLFKYKKNIKVNFDSNRVSMNIYKDLKL